MRTEMKWYWLLRITLGVGVIGAVALGIIVTSDQSVGESMDEEFTVADVFIGLGSATFGAFWDLIFAAGLASYIVWDEWNFVQPPIWRIPTPRTFFQ